MPLPSELLEGLLWEMLVGCSPCPGVVVGWGAGVN